MNVTLGEIELDQYTYNSEYIFSQTCRTHIDDCEAEGLLDHIQYDGDGEGVATCGIKNCLKDAVGLLSASWEDYDM
jgi:hypothetical protein